MVQGADTLGPTDRDLDLDGGDQPERPDQGGWHGLTAANANRLHEWHQEMASRNDAFARAIRTFDTIESGAKMAIVGATALTLRVAGGAAIFAGLAIPAAGEWAIAHGIYGNAQHLRELQRTWLVGSTDQTQYESMYPQGVNPDQLDADGTLKLMRSLTQQQAGVMDRIRYNRHQKTNWGHFRRTWVANVTRLNPIPKILEQKPKPRKGDVSKTPAAAAPTPGRG